MDKHKLIGNKFGRLTVIGFDDEWSATRPARHAKWVCLCECGETKSIFRSALVSGDTRSCGCLNKEVASISNLKHGMSQDNPTYRSWNSMVMRCKFDKKYAGRVSVCDEWLKFDNFLRDMGPRPHGTTIDRIDPYGDYTPSNCRWVDYVVQGRNKRNSRLVTAFGSTLHVNDWSEMYGVKAPTIWLRLTKGWNPEVAVTAQRYACTQRKLPASL